MYYMVLLVGDVEDGIELRGPFPPGPPQKELSRLTRTLRPHYHLEVFTLEKPRVFAPAFEPCAGQEVWALAAGDFKGGFEFFGPFPSQEAAEEVGMVTPRYTKAVKLVPPEGGA